MGSIKAASIQDLPPGKAISVTVDHKTIALFNVSGEYFAIDDACTHAGGNLSEGEVDGKIVTCPWHGETFDISTGAVLGPPATSNVGSYKVTLNGNDIYIEIP